MKKYRMFIDPVHIIIVILSMIVLVKLIMSKPAKRANTKQGIIQDSPDPYRLGGEAQVYIPELLQSLKE